MIWLNKDNPLNKVCRRISHLHQINAFHIQKLLLFTTQKTMLLLYFKNVAHILGHSGLNQICIFWPLSNYITGFCIKMIFGRYCYRWTGYAIGRISGKSYKTGIILPNIWTNIRPYTGYLAKYKFPVILWISRHIPDILTKKKSGHIRISGQISDRIPRNVSGQPEYPIHP